MVGIERTEVCGGNGGRGDGYGGSGGVRWNGGIGWGAINSGIGDKISIK